MAYVLLILINESRTMLQLTTVPRASAQHYYIETTSFQETSLHWTHFFPWLMLSRRSMILRDQPEEIANNVRCPEFIMKVYILQYHGDC